MAVRDPEITRKCILDAALKLFAERGFHGTNVPEVATQASVGAGSIYRHFDDKIALVNVLYREWKAKFRKAIMIPPPDPAHSFENQFREYWARLWKFYRSYPEALVFLDLHAHGAYLTQEARMEAIEFEKDLCSWVEAGQESGVIGKAEPAVLIAMVYGSFLGLIRHEQAVGTISAGSEEESGKRAWALIAP
tara:strand:+ start:559 stop:1134 length:576 start_codon:yes stop_codon:yes gene_type:complete